MEREHALIVLKSHFPNAYIETVRNGDVYLIDGVNTNIGTMNPGQDFILYVINENSTNFTDVVWNAHGINDEHPDVMKHNFIPIEVLNEKQLLKLIKYHKEFLEETK